MLLSKRDERDLQLLIKAERKDPARVRKIFADAKEAGTTFVSVSEVTKQVKPSSDR